jgi:hypothetical protein
MGKEGKKSLRENWKEFLAECKKQYAQEMEKERDRGKAVDEKLDRFEQRVEGFEKKMEDWGKKDEAWSQGKAPMPVRMLYVSVLMVLGVNTFIVCAFESVIVLVCICSVLMLGGLGMIFAPGNRTSKITGVLVTLINLAFIIYGWLVWGK